MMASESNSNAIGMTKLTRYTAGALIMLAIIGLLFRATLYWKLPVAPGMPIGSGDIIELVLFYGILLLALLAMVLSLLLMVIPQWRDLRTAIVVLIISLITPPCYYILHAMTPRLM